MLSRFHRPCTTAVTSSSDRVRWPACPERHSVNHRQKHRSVWAVNPSREACMCMFVYPGRDYLLLASERTELLCRPDPGFYPSPAIRHTGRSERDMQVRNWQLDGWGIDTQTDRQTPTCVIVSMSRTLTGQGWTSTPFFTRTVRVWDRQNVWFEMQKNKTWTHWGALYHYISHHLSYCEPSGLTITTCVIVAYSWNLHELLWLP